MKFCECLTLRITNHVGFAVEADFNLSYPYKPWLGAWRGGRLWILNLLDPVRFYYTSDMSEAYHRVQNEKLYQMRCK